MSRPPIEHERYEEMACAYVLGALEGEDARAFEAHVAAGCAECRTLYPQLVATAQALALSAEPVAPPEGLRARILAAAGVAGESSVARATGVAGATGAARPAPRPTPRSRVPIVPLALAAAAIFAIVSWRALDLDRRLRAAHRDNSASLDRIARLETEIDALRATEAEHAALIKLLEEPESGLVTLASLKPAPGASGKILWDKKAGRGYLWAAHLPRDPDGKDYQLWAIEGTTPRSAGVFSVAADGSALIPLDTLASPAQIAAFAITIEPAGGVPAPTGEMVLLGKVGG